MFEGLCAVVWFESEVTHLSFAYVVFLESCQEDVFIWIQQLISNACGCPIHPLQ